MVSASECATSEMGMASKATGMARLRKVSVSPFTTLLIMDGNPANANAMLLSSLMTCWTAMARAFVSSSDASCTSSSVTSRPCPFSVAFIIASRRSREMRSISRLPGLTPKAVGWIFTPETRLFRESASRMRVENPVLAVSLTTVHF